MKTTRNNKRMTAKARRRKQIRNRILLAILIVAVIILGALGWQYLANQRQISNLKNAKKPHWISKQIIPVDGVSRNGEKIIKVNDIVIHYVGNPGSTAQQNRDFYAGSQSNVSSHFVVGIEGEIIQCIPLNEMSAASNWRNNDTISIETCHPDSTGKFTKKTYKSLVRLVAWLEDKCGLTEKHVIRHYDITGKECPRYLVNNNDAWETFKKKVKKQRLKIQEE